MPKRKALRLPGLSDRIQSLIDRQFGGKTAALARKADVPASTLRSVISSDTAPGSDIALAIAAAGGVSLDWLLTGRESHSHTAEPEDTYGPNDAFTAEGNEHDTHRVETAARVILRAYADSGILPPNLEVGPVAEAIANTYSLRKKMEASALTKKKTSTG